MFKKMEFPLFSSKQTRKATFYLIFVSKATHE